MLVVSASSMLTPIFIQRHDATGQELSRLATSAGLALLTGLLLWCSISRLNRSSGAAGRRFWCRGRERWRETGAIRSSVVPSWLVAPRVWQRPA
jgi:hypothetical protein